LASTGFSSASTTNWICKLERELKHPLLTCTLRAARLTPHRETFMRRAVHILEELEAATHEALGTPWAFHGPGRTGVIPTIAPYLLPRLLKVLRARYPEVEMTLHETITTRLLQLLQGYTIDFALIALPAS